MGDWASFCIFYLSTGGIVYHKDCFMLRYSIDTLKDGMKLGKPIYSEDGSLLLGKGVIVSDIFIRRLKELEVTSVYIHDKDTEDITQTDSISEMVRGATISHMRELFGPLEELTKEIKDLSRDTIMSEISSERFQKTFRENPAFKSIKADAGNIVDQLMSGEVTLGLNSIKTHDNYTFQHSIDVAIVSIMLGRKVGLPVEKLRELGIGCILHDMGKVFVPKEILNKPGKLTEEEFKQMKLHPTIGYELTKGTTSIGVLPPHVALQHHEKQNGGGYPRGLVGSNRLIPSKEPGTIHQYGSLVAVADVYDALSSDRPYRKAMPPEKVISILRELSGTHLNSDILGQFLAITPVHPVGATIRVTRGDYLYHSGVVVRVNEDYLDRPVIRLLFDGQKRRIDPVEINLLEENMEIMSTIL